VSTEDDRFHYVLVCPCGVRQTGATEDAIVEVGFAHLRDAHPDKATEYEREHILLMALKVLR
jgi:hypothetical protein